MLLTGVTGRYIEDSETDTNYKAKQFSGKKVRLVSGLRQIFYFRSLLSPVWRHENIKPWLGDVSAVRLTGHVQALDLGHEGQDVSGGVFSTEDVVLPALDGRKMALGGGAVEELGEVLVKHVFGALWN